MSKINPLSADILTGIFRTSPKDPLRIINREGTMIEFKESYSHGGMAQYFKTIAAFANNSGGYIIFGVGDRPRRLVGLKEKNRIQFEGLKVEEFSKNLLEFFSPEIRWDHCTFEFKDMSFGVIYTFPLTQKPCICKKSYDTQNTKYALREGDIFYRYGGRSERIRYEELNAIVEDVRQKEQQKWLNFAQRAAKIGVENACILDLGTGKLTGNGETIVIDQELLDKISFIKEGEFVETKGKPALRLIGDIKDMSEGKVVFKETTKKVVKAIEISDIVKSFLQNIKVEEPLEYIRAICSASTANYPVYYLLHQAGMTSEEAVELVDLTTSRLVAKKALIKRLQGKRIEKGAEPTTNTTASMKKKEYITQWKDEMIVLDFEEIKYILAAALSLCDEDIIVHQDYIKRELLEIYNQYYEVAKPAVATVMRKTICRVDEILYFTK